MTHALRTTVLLLMIGVSPGFAWGLSIGQKDTFQDGTTNGWGVSLLDISSPTPPVNMAGGGPAGGADSFLKIKAVAGGGPGNLLSAINLPQWAGGYIPPHLTPTRRELDKPRHT